VSAAITAASSSSVGVGEIPATLSADSLIEPSPENM
jgi:hypothetical protein